MISNGIVPNVNLGINVDICANDTLTLDAGVGNSYIWNTGATTRTISANAAGSYSVVVTSSTGCTGGDTIVIATVPSASVNTISRVITGNSVSFTSDAAFATNYIWSFGDGGTATTATPTHVYAANGTYTVRVIATNRCTSDTAVITVVITSVGINNTMLNNNINVFPNPAVNNVMVASKAEVMESYSIFNNVGALVKEGRMTDAHNETIDISTMPAGMYLLRIKTSNGVASHKLQIAK